MAWMDTISDIVSRYTGMGGGAAAAPADPHRDYCDISQSAPPQVMADALAHTFRSDQTPSFPEMVSTLFRQSSPSQQAALVNQLVSALGPAGLANVPALAELANRSGSGQRVTPELARRIPADQVQQLADQAHEDDPSIVDRVSGFYAKHPDVVKALGGTALAIAIQHIARRR